MQFLLYTEYQIVLFNFPCDYQKYNDLDLHSYGFDIEEFFIFKSPQKSFKWFKAKSKLFAVDLVLYCRHRFRDQNRSF